MQALLVLRGKYMCASSDAGLHTYMPGAAGSDAVSVSVPSFYDIGCCSEGE